ncbi:MAG: FliM/FliN family flagellar motor switch protein [Gammaproteobacteria bacterium]
MNTLFVPPLIDPAIARVDNLLASRHIETNITLAGHHPATLSLQPSHFARDYNMAFVVVVNQVTVTVLIDQEVLNAYLGFISEEAIYADLPDALREGVGVRFWEEVVAGLAQAQGVSLTLQRVSLTQNVNHVTANASACLVIQLGTESFYGQVSVGLDVMPRLEASICDVYFRHRYWAWVGLDGRTQLSRDELVSVEPFDVILFDVVWQDLLVVAGGSDRCFRASIKNTLTEEALGVGIPGPMQSSSRLSNGATPVSVAVTLEEVVEDVQNPEASGDVNAVPITLTFELDRQQVTLGDLMQIGPGYTFNLAANAQAPITIRANGQIIGSAELVQIGDQKLGARVLALQNL